jgi:superoxide dismutase, Cu-Zn family
MLRYSGLMIACGFVVAGCGGSKAEEAQAPGVTTGAEEPSAERAAEPTAKAVFETAPGVEMSGSAKFTQTPTGVLAKVTVENASPGEHGIHVHQKGDCSDIPNKSMGEHFAPAGNPHGLPEQQPEHHMGDMGNIDIAEQGTGELVFELKDAKLGEGPTSLLGKALVIHEKEDIGTQPSGDSGKPIACAIIEAE